MLRDLLVEAQAELQEEDKKIAKEKIKTRIKEIRATKKILEKMKRQFEDMLDEPIS